MSRPTESQFALRRGLDSSLTTTWFDAVVLFLWIVPLCVAQWLPCDSVVVAMGGAVTQNALWIVALLAWSAREYFARDRDPTSLRTQGPTGWKILGDRRIGIAIGATWAIWLVIDTALVPGRGNARFAINVMWQWLTLVGVLWATPRVIRNPMHRSLILNVILGLAFSAAFHGLYQYFWSMPLDRLEYAKDPITMLQKSGVTDTSVGSAQRLLFESRLQSTEPIGPFSLTNSLAGFLAPALILGLGFLIENRRRTFRLADWVVRALALLAIMACLALTKSRTGWLAAAMSIVLLVATHPTAWSWIAPRKRWLAVLGAVALIIVVLGVAWVDPLILWEAPKSLAFRWQYWLASFHMILDHPWLGVGLGNFQNYYAQYKLPEASETIADPHSFVIETASLLGVPGLLLLISGMICLGYRCFTNSRERVSTEPSESSSAFSSQLEFETRLNQAAQSWRVQRGIASGAMVFAALLVWLIPDALGPSPEEFPYLIAMIFMQASLWLCPASASVSNRTLWLAIGAGLIHMLASGGWMTPGNTTCLALLAGLCIAKPWSPFESNRATAQSRTSSGDLVQPGFRGAPMVVVFAACLGFFWSCWSPLQVTHAWQMEKARTLESALEGAERAMAGDRWDPEPAKSRAEMLQAVVANQLSRNHRSPADQEKLDEAIRQWLARDPHSWSAQAEAGRMRLGLAVFQEDQLPLAVKNYKNATLFYPEEAWLHLQLAIAAKLAGDEAVATESLQRAMEIDGKTTHQDRRLAAHVVFWPKIRQQSVPPASSPPSMPQGYYRGEPAGLFLRTLLQPAAESLK